MDLRCELVKLLMGARDVGELLLVSVNRAFAL